MPYDKNDPKKTDFAVFKNTKSTSPKAPEFVGTIELGREIMKTMVTMAKEGTFPIKLQFAMWPERLSAKGNPWRSAKLSVAEERREPEPEPEPEQPAEQPEEKMPWD